jgi:hypothetical protein
MMDLGGEVLEGSVGYGFVRTHSQRLSQMIENRIVRVRALSVVN